MLRWFVNYLRQSFCKHDFEFDEGIVTHENGQARKVFMLCRKCGYHKNFWKYVSEKRTFL